MTVPPAVAPPSIVPAFNIQPSSLSLDDTAAAVVEDSGSRAHADAKLRETKSTPALSSMNHDLSPRLSELSMHAAPQDAHPAAHVPPMVEQSTIPGALPRKADPGVSTMSADTQRTVEEEDFDDPLGITSRAPASERLDFAAFASHNAFRD